MSLGERGYEVFENAIDATDVGRLRVAVASLPMGRRLLALPEVAELARCPAIRRIVEAALGPGARAVRGLFFDKTADANWGVPWHQDLAVAVKARIDAEGFRGWSVKNGVPHVHPPAEILERMVALRVHLDPCDQDNGGLRMIPGSHALGRLGAEQVDEAAKQPWDAPVLRAGDVLAMRPLLLHASSKVRDGRPRRVIHIEYAADALPAGLEWFEEG